MTLQDHHPGRQKQGATTTACPYDVGPYYWINAQTGRYYVARLLINLFGQWELEQAWGSVDSRRGHLRYMLWLA